MSIKVEIEGKKKKKKTLTIIYLTFNNEKYFTWKESEWVS